MEKKIIRVNSDWQKKAAMEGNVESLYWGGKKAQILGPGADTWLLKKKC